MSRLSPAQSLTARAEISNLVVEAKMLVTHEEYIVDKDGERKAVIVPWQEWQAVVEALEEIDDVQAYDEAKRQPSDPVPFEQAVREIREKKVG